MQERNSIKSRMLWYVMILRQLREHLYFSVIAVFSAVYNLPEFHLNAQTLL